MLQVNNGGCDQLCHNRPGTFMCEVSGSDAVLAVELEKGPSEDSEVSPITEQALTRAFSWLKAPTSTFSFKTLCYAKQVLTHGN